MDRASGWSHRPSELERIGSDLAGLSWMMRRIFAGHVRAYSRATIEPPREQGHYLH